jgi:hypothetical protein
LICWWLRLYMLFAWEATVKLSGWTNSIEEMVSEPLID